MKKFLLKFLCFLVLLAIPLGLLGSFYDRQNPISHEMGTPPEEMPEQITLAAVGSSHALYGMKLAPYCDTYFNFSMPGQTPRYDARVLRQFEDHIADGATVLMDVSYMSPFWTEPESEFLEKQTRYYRLLSKENIVDYDPKEAFRIRLNQAIPATRIFYTDISSLLQSWKDSRTVSAAEPEASGPIPWYEDIPHQQDVLRKKHQGLIEPVFPDMNPAMQQGYEEIIAMARAHNWRLIAVTTPFSDGYNEMYDEEFYRVFYDHIDTLFTRNGVEYWDYSHDPLFTGSHSYFVDLDHLSPEGAEQFSALLAQRLGLS